MPLDNNYEHWINKNPNYHKCPCCENGQLETRIKRSFIVRHLFVWMDVKRYQCNACRRKVYIKNAPENHQLDY